MTRSQHRLHRSPPGQSQGFSLVELLVAALIMAFSSMGGTLLFGQATRQASAIRASLQQQFLISNELAVIRDHNDRYSCPSGSCSVDLNGDPPNQGEYIPPNAPSAPTPYTTFLGLCQSGLANGLISHINTAAPTLTTGEVTRLASLDPASLDPDATSQSGPPHRYLVTWTAGGRQVRQVQLIPTVAAWCP